MSRKVQIQVLLEPAQADALSEEARRRQVSRSVIVREAIETYLSAGATSSSGSDEGRRR